MLFKRKKCKHDFEYHRTDKLQLDHMGYPLRLFKRQCKKCGYTDQLWIDVSVEELGELKTGESILIPNENINITEVQKYYGSCIYNEKE